MPIGLLVFLSLSMPAAAEEMSKAKFIRALDQMMVKLGPQSARASKAIRQAYRDHLNLLVLEGYEDLEGALRNGGLAPLPHDTPRFNVAPRLAGLSPIGEKDLAHQVSYIAARPATIGALLDVASRVKSGPIEVTSLVRHAEYQGALRATNANATTAVPMHTMGLAFDIALVNTPLETVHEIRQVLIRMRNAGEVLFIGERKQLVFHVVPHPRRLGHFQQLYAEALGFQPVGDRAQVVALSKRRDATATVSAEVVAVLPADEFVEEWWEANHEDTDLTIEVVAEAEAAEMSSPSAPVEPPVDVPRSVLLMIGLSAGALAATWRRMARRQPAYALFHRA